MSNTINEVVWVARYITKEWTTVLASSAIQRCLTDVGFLEHRKFTKPNGAIVNQYRWGN